MGQLGKWCVLDRSTGIEHTIEIESWDSGRGGGWSYTHTGGECTCDAGTHGGRCEFSCSDGVANGEEDAVDCGGPCAPCVEGWECSHNGTFAGAEVVYDQVGGDGTCDPISEGVCLTRGPRQGIFNLVSESVYIAGSPAGTLWSSVLPCGSDFLPSEDWRSAVGFAGEGPRSISGRSFCMLDQTTGHEWTVVFDSWARSATGGAFSYTRNGSVCECDPGFSGETCADTVPAP
jgi:hypothetical protein